MRDPVAAQQAVAILQHDVALEAHLKHKRILHRFARAAEDLAREVAEDARAGQSLLLGFAREANEDSVGLHATGGVDQRDLAKVVVDLVADTFRDHAGVAQLRGHRRDRGRWILRRLLRIIILTTAYCISKSLCRLNITSGIGIS